MKHLLTSLFAAACIVHTAKGEADRVIQLTQIKQSFSDLPHLSSEVIEDLGDIRPPEAKPLFKRINFSATLRTEFTSNALYTGNHSSGDFLFQPTISASYEHPLGSGLSLTMNARAESFIYAEFDQSSFWGFSGALLLNWQANRDALRFYAGIEPSWYASINTGDQLSEAIGSSAGVQKEWSFNRDRTILFLGYNFTHYTSSPAVDDRCAHRWTAGISHQITPTFYGQAYYSYQWSDYSNASRRDSRNLVGVNFVKQLNSRWTANVTAYLADNDSTLARSTYQVFGTGLGITCQF